MFIIIIIIKQAVTCNISCTKGTVKHFKYDIKAVFAMSRAGLHNPSFARTSYPINLPRYKTGFHGKRSQKIIIILWEGRKEGTYLFDNATVYNTYL